MNEDIGTAYLKYENRVKITADIMARVIKKNLYSFKNFIIKLINYTNLEDLESIK